MKRRISTLDQSIEDKKHWDARWDSFLFSCIQTGTVDKDEFYLIVDGCNKTEKNYQKEKMIKQERERSIRERLEGILTY